MIHRHPRDSGDVLIDSTVTRLIEQAIVEDLALGDITTDAIIDPDALGRSSILVKEDGIVAGLGVAGLVFQFVDPAVTLQPCCEDGTRVGAGNVAAHLDGPLAGMIKAERTALNFLQRMSGIATLTRSFVDQIRGTNARITDTRKTAPGLRVLDKLAVRFGGGVNHRFGLDDMVLIKDNHIAAAGDITTAVQRCLEHLSQRHTRPKVEVEVATIPQLEQVLEFRGIHRIMLDNFRIDEMRKAVALVNKRVEVEASGGITLANVREVAETGVDFISVGALTHSPRALDMSLELDATIAGTTTPS